MFFALFFHHPAPQARVSILQSVVYVLKGLKKIAQKCNVLVFDSFYQFLSVLSVFGVECVGIHGSPGNYTVVQFFSF